MRNWENKINNLYKRLELDSKYIYLNPVVKPFIDNYLYKGRSSFKLFGAYFFAYNLMTDYYLDNDHYDWVFLQDEEYQKMKQAHKLDFKNKRIRKLFLDHNLSYFVGYTTKNYPIFLRFDLWDDNTYHYCGFSVKSDKDKNRDEYFNDRKQFGYLKNIPIIMNLEHNDPLLDYSSKCKINSNLKEGNPSYK